jgi:hypothetical protein
MTDKLWNTEYELTPSNYPGATEGHIHTYIHADDFPKATFSLYS